MKISIAEVRRKLPVGQEFICTFIGINVHFAKPSMVNTTRRVTKQSSNEMVSMVIEGDNKGKLVYNQWKGITADEYEGLITLSSDEGPYVEIIICN